METPGHVTHAHVHAHVHVHVHVHVKGELSPLVHVGKLRQAHARPRGIHFHIFWYLARPKYTFMSARARRRLAGLVRGTGRGRAKCTQFRRCKFLGRPSVRRRAGRVGSFALGAGNNLTCRPVRGHTHPEVFHARCLRAMARVTRKHTLEHNISTEEL